MSLQNPVKNSAHDRANGLLANASGLGIETGTGFWATVRSVILTVTLTGAAVLFGVDQYFDISIKNQELNAVSFDSQGVLAANHLTPKQAADKLNAGETIYTKDGKPLVGKSLTAFLTYLTEQGKAQAEITAATAKSAPMKW